MTIDEKLDLLLSLMHRLLAALAEDEQPDEVVRSLDGDVVTKPRDQNASLG